MVPSRNQVQVVQYNLARNIQTQNVFVVRPKASGGSKKAAMTDAEGLLAPEHMDNPFLDTGEAEQPIGDREQVGAKVRELPRTLTHEI